MSPVIVVRPDLYAATGKSEKLNYKAALERGQEARREAGKQFSLRIDYFNKAAEAYRRGYPDVAAYYSQMVKKINKRLNRRHRLFDEEFFFLQIASFTGQTSFGEHTSRSR